MNRLVQRAAPAASLVAIALACIAAPSAVAKPVAPGRWELLEPASQGSPNATADPGMFRDAAGLLHVAWIHENSSSSQTLLEARFTSDGSLPAAPTTVVGDWTNLADAAFLDAPGGPQIFFGGQQTTQQGTPLGLMTALTQGPGWGPPTQLVNEYGTVSAAPGSGAVSYEAFESESRPAVYVNGASAPLLRPTTGIAGMTEASPTVVNGGGTPTVAWCGWGDGIGGVYVQQIDPSSNTLTGSPTVMPGTTTTYGGKPQSTCVLQSTVSRRTAVAARAGGGVYVAATAGYPRQGKVLLWKVGGSTLTAANASKISHKEPEVFADPNGRLWVGWVQTDGPSTVIVVRRSNRNATVLGAPVTLRNPRGWTPGSFEGSASAGQLDVVAQFSHLTDQNNAIQHTIVLPGLTLRITRVGKRRNGRRKVTYQVLDAGDAVSGATVTAAGGQGKTGATGKVTLTLRGSTHARATKAGYAKGTV